jgi:hypothetical protein
MVMLAFLSGSQIPSCDIAAILRKRYTCLTLGLEILKHPLVLTHHTHTAVIVLSLCRLNIRGSTLRARSLDYKVKLTKVQVLRYVHPHHPNLSSGGNVVADQ